MATVDEMRAELEQIHEESMRLDRRRSELQLAIEEAEGRGDSHRAQFARAYLAGDLGSMTRLCAEDTARRYRETGRWSEHQEQAEQILQGARHG